MRAAASSITGGGSATVVDEPRTDSSQPRISAVIPALNEAPSITVVVLGLRRQSNLHLHEIIVVDNGSTDGTGALAAAAGATVVREERRGYGYACRAGVLAATGDVVLLLDGDAADDPSDAAAVLAPLLSGQAELVIGSRAFGTSEAGAMTPQQVLGNRLDAWLMRRLYGVEVTDLGPLRAIRRGDLLALAMHELTFGWSVEMMVKSARAGYRLAEVPVSYRRRVGVSKVGGTLRGSLQAGWCILATTARYARWSPTATVGAPVIEATNR
jgi:glycosyltransferase involved in cell wall biosynthesis